MEEIKWIEPRAVLHKGENLPALIKLRDERAITMKVIHNRVKEEVELENRNAMYHREESDFVSLLELKRKLKMEKRYERDLVKYPFALGDNSWEG
jgi:hypothetical protein